MSIPSQPKTNLFVIGAMKAGTTSVADALAAHPDVFISSIKEPNHFGTEVHSEEFRKTVKSQYADIAAYLEMEPRPVLHAAYVEQREHYDRLFAGSGDYRYRLDSTVSYLTSPVAAANIASYNPDAKIILIQRDPVERAWSEFLMNRAIGRTGTNYVAELEKEAAAILAGEHSFFGRYLQTGWYDFHLARYAQLFPPEQIYRTEFSLLKSDGDRFYSELGQFLGLEGLGESERLNSAKMPRFATLNRILHQTGLKAFAGQRLPGGLKEWVKSNLLYSNKKDRMPDDFADCFRKLDADIRGQRPELDAALSQPVQPLATR